MSAPMSRLFAPFTLRGLALHNRIVVSPMCQYSAVEGRATDWHLVHWAQMLQSNAALAFVEATAVTDTGRITPGCLGLYDDGCEEALSRRLAIARAAAPAIRVGIQLAHAGRKGSRTPPWDGGGAVAVGHGAWQTLAPSAIAQQAGDPVPRAMTHDDLAAVRAAFVAAAQRAERIGFDAVELHFAHGYLLNEFLSPLANRRDDRYGGSFEGRIRFPLEVFAAVRETWPGGRPLGVRISATDWVDGGWTLEDSIALAKRLAAMGCDFIDVSGGGISPLQQVPVGPGYQVPLARAVRAASSMPTIAVGMITDPVQAETIVAAGDADLVALARGMLWDPRWPWHAAAALGAQVHAPKQYARAAPAGTKVIAKR
jgi:2,4-dienoyl-CoA reductase-like NADH-dependent reductase (Old Yellow Enzyme family)